MRTLLNVKCVLASFGMVSFLFSACNNQRLGTIEGSIKGAEGQLLVLEHLTDGAPRMVDTLRLSADGTFSFRPEVEPGPDFFSLRLGSQSIQLVIDTLLTPVKVSADADNLIGNYEVQDDLNKQLKEAVQQGNRLRGQIVSVNKLYNGGGLGKQQARDSILSLVNAYKSHVLKEFVYLDPSSPASYYLMFETMQGLSIFDVNDREDFRAFGAVANTWKFKYPASPRNKVLEKMTLAGLAQRAKAVRNDSIAQHTPVEVRTYPELKLTNADDKVVSLTETQQASALTVVDYTAYYMDYSPVHNMALNRLYDKFAAKGLQIYQVCLDYDEHFWKTSADNLPWITVRDQNVAYDTQGNIQYSAAALAYNVTKLPTSFIIDDKGQILVRIEGDDAKIEEVVKKNMK